MTDHLKKLSAIQSKLLIGFGLVISLFFILIKILPIPLFQCIDEVIENTFYDLRLKDIYQPISETPVVILAIDEDSINEFGTWPWPMPLMTKVLDRLQTQRPTLIAFDTNFLEANSNIVDGFQNLIEKYAGEKLDRQSLATIFKDVAGLVENRLSFTQSFNASQIVLGAWLKSEFVEKGQLPPPFMKYVNGLQSVPTIIGFEGNASSLQNHAMGGILNISAEPNKMLRSQAMLFQKDNALYANLALATFRSHWSTSKVALIVSGNEQNRFLHKIKIGDASISTETDGKIWIPYRGPSNTIKHYSVLELFNNKLASDTFKDKIVFIGFTNKTLGNFYKTPLDAAMSSTEIQAQMTASFIDGYLPHRMAANKLIQVGLILLLGCALSILLVQVTETVGLAVSIGAIFVLVITSHLSWQLGGVYFPVACMLLMITFIYLGQCGLRRGFFKFNRRH